MRPKNRCMEYELESLLVLGKLVEDVCHPPPSTEDKFDCDKMVYHMVCISKIVYDHIDHNSDILHENLE